MLFLLIVLGLRTAYATLVVPPIDDAYIYNKHETFMMFTTELNFNDAQDVCANYRNLSGKLAKIDSYELLSEIIHLAAVNESFFNGEYWIGVIQPAKGKIIWIKDCELVLFTRYHLKFSNADRCFYHESDHSVQTGKCSSESRAFLCQISGDLETCPHDQRLESKAQQIINDPFEIPCTDQCNAMNTCWGIISLDDSDKTCILLTTDGTSTGVARVTTKYCLSVYLNEDSLTAAQAAGANGGNEDPYYGCSSIGESLISIVATPTVYPTSTSSVVSMTSSLWTCIPETITVEVAPVVSMATVQYNTTHTNMVYIQHTVTVTYIDEVASEIAREIERNLTVPVKSSYHYKTSLTSAHDARPSSQMIGYIGLMFVIVPIVVLMVADISKVIHDFKFGPTFA